MAPEFMKEGAGSKSTAADVFSLGLTVYELAAGPSFDIPSEGTNWHRLRSGSPPPLPEFRSRELVEVINSLLTPSASLRPTASSVAERPVVSSYGERPCPFLSSYVNDVASYDLSQERSIALSHRIARSKRITPTASGIAASFQIGEEREGVHTPTPDGQPLDLFFPRDPD